MKKLFSRSITLAIIIFIGLILYNPKICLEGAFSGLILCGRVIIPSLYPFTFCVLFILKSGMLESLKFINNFTQKIFGLNAEYFSLFLLSLIGGYPLGAKLLNDAQIDLKNASIMLNYCVNAGPAFIILSVGNGIFSSQRIGFLLFLAHVLPSFFMAFLFRKKIKSAPVDKKKTPINTIDNFIQSASGAATTLINVCSLVILFSVISDYLKLFPFLKPISFVLEVTNGINQTRNIYLISALLGFAGICIWCQVFSLSKNIKINFPRFLFCRIFHACSSSVLTLLLIKIFNITIPTLSNGKIFVSYPFFQNGSVGISLIITGLVFIISLSGKTFAGNIYEDIV